MKRDVSEKAKRALGSVGARAFPSAVTSCTCEWWMGASTFRIWPLSPSCRGFTCLVFTFTSFTFTRPVLRKT